MGRGIPCRGVFARRVQARTAARRRPLIAAAAGVWFVLLTAASPGMTAPTSPPIRITLVSHTWTDEDSGLSEDAAAGLERFKAAARPCCVITRWVPLRRTNPRERGRPALYADIGRTVRDVARSSDVVLAWGDLLTGPILAAAREYPRVRFGVATPVDVEHLPRNVALASFRQEEEAFLAGAAAAMASRSGIVGFIGSHESTPRRVGFEAGAFFANPHVRVLADNVGFPAILGWDDETRVSGWIAEGAFEPSLHDVRKAQEVALAQYARGADVIYANAGGSDAGVYEAAAIRRRWVIGSGSPRTEGTLPARWRAQQLVVITEHADNAAYDLASRLVSGRRLPHRFLWGLTYPGAPALLIDVASHSGQFGRIAPYESALMKEIEARRLAVPFSEPQLAGFKRAFPQ